MRSTKMLKQASLRTLKQAAERSDWIAAGDEYLEIALQAEGPADLFGVEAITALRLRFGAACRDRGPASTSVSTLRPATSYRARP